MQPPEYKKIINGTTEWFRDAKCTIRHREDGPAIIRADGTQLWYRNDTRHREDGPAVICPDIILCWYIYGVLHRTDGPAAIYKNGSQYWWLNGKPYNNKKKYQKAAKLSDEDMTMLLLRYNLNEF